VFLINGFSFEFKNSNHKCDLRKFMMNNVNRAFVQHLYKEISEAVESARKTPDCWRECVSLHKAETIKCSMLVLQVKTTLVMYLVYSNSLFNLNFEKFKSISFLFEFQNVLQIGKTVQEIITLSLTLCRSINKNPRATSLLLPGSLYERIHQPRYTWILFSRQ